MEQILRVKDVGKCLQLQQEVFIKENQKSSNRFSNLFMFKTIYLKVLLLVSLYTAIFLFVNKQLISHINTIKIFLNCTITLFRKRNRIFYDLFLQCK